MYKVVIAEDEELERIYIRTIIEDNLPDVFVVGEAKTGNEAIAILHREKADLLIVDINMPTVDGLEVIKVAKHSSPHMKVIITTAYDDFEIAHTAIKLRVDEYFLKPIRKEVLLDTITGYLKTFVSEKKADEKKLAELIHAIYQCSYKESRDILKEYIDIVYVTKENVEAIAEELKKGALAILQAGSELGAKAERNFSFEVETLKLKVITHNKYDVFNAFCNMLELIFDGMNKNGYLAENGMKQIVDYIERNFKKGISLESVANHANISTYYLSKIFKKEMGINFVTYITNQKIELAKELLTTTDIPISNIAMDLAYNEPSYFSKVFKRSVGISPTEYRENFLAERSKSYAKI